MISHKAIGELRTLEGLSWITALKSTQIRSLVQGGELQLGLFDERNLFEFSHPEFPGERLMACRNVDLGKLRAHKREALLVATEKELEKVRARIDNGALVGRDKIGVRVGKVVNKYKVSKHFVLTIEENGFEFKRLEDQIAAEAALDGLYVIRTSVPEKQMTSDEAVRSYKALAEVERAFRSMKTIDLRIRPIHHRLEGRVRAHIFLCMLAYYVEWHMREGVARVDVRRRGPGGEKASRPGCRRDAFRGSARQSVHAQTQRRLNRAQLPHLARRSVDNRAQYLRGVRREAQRHNLPDDHAAQSRARSRAPIAPVDHCVATRSTPKNGSTS